MVSILSERRAFQPYGLAGGEPGSRGLNLLTLVSDGTNREINLGGKNTVAVSSGDRLQILTPGGGGYGCLSAATSESVTRKGPPEVALRAAGSLHQYVLNQESV